MTVLAVIINAVAKVPSWGLTTPKWPGNPVATPDFGLLGKVSLFGGFDKVGVLTGVLFVFTVLLSCFFDAMGTIMGISDEARLTDAQGQHARHQQGPLRRRHRGRRGRCLLLLGHHLLRRVHRRRRRGRPHRLRERRHRRPVRGRRSS